MKERVKRRKIAVNTDKAGKLVDNLGYNRNACRSFLLDFSILASLLGWPLGVRPEYLY